MKTIPFRSLALDTLAGLVLFFLPTVATVRAQSVYDTPCFVSTLAGAAGRGFGNGPGSTAKFSSPTGMAVDHLGHVWVADSDNHAIRRISPAGVVTTVAGKPLSPGSEDGTGVGSRFDTPCGLAVEPSGSVIVADWGNHTIRRVTPDGVVTTLAGAAGIPGTTNARRLAARFNQPIGVAVDGLGNIFVCDSGNATIRQISPDGTVTTLAGQAGIQGTTDGTGAAATFRFPRGIVADKDGVLFVTDMPSHTIRRITPAGVVTTFAGLPEASGSKDGVGPGARFNRPSGLAIDAEGNLYVGEFENATVRKITATRAVSTLAGTAGVNGIVDGHGPQARLSVFIAGIAVSPHGSLHIADTGSHRIRTAVFAPQITASPVAQSSATGGNVVFAVEATSEIALAFQWRKNGVDIPGANSATLTLANVQPADAGSYSVVIFNLAGSTISAGAVLNVTPALPTARLANLSIRTSLGQGQTVIVGLATTGGARDVLVRAVGPGLAQFGLAGAMADPRLDLFSGPALVLGNDNWALDLAPTFASAGAFALPRGSRDAALRQKIAGANSVQARGTGTGVVLLEAYDLGEGTASRLVNVSARNRVGSGDDILIAGFNLTGTGTKRLLVRAVGPGLAAFGVTGTLADPVLELYAGANRIASNDNWPADAASAFTAVGAFALPTGSRDAALVVTLPPGTYTAQVRGADDTAGEALVEIYELP